MTAIEKADQLREEAIKLLLAERHQIDDRLHQLGYTNEKAAPPIKKRGRPRKPEEGNPVPVQPADHCDKNE